MPYQDQPLQKDTISLWLDTTPETKFPSLQQSLQDGLHVDVAIVGGGITGITAAALLKAEGKTVAVLEAHRICQGVTGYTSAKITSLHNLVYDYLIRKLGEEKAFAYGDANQAAIKQIARFIDEKQIECDFTITDAYTYTEDSDQVDNIKAEAQAALKLGLPASFDDNTSLPFPVKGAVRFDDQAQFHPRKYLLALAQDIPGDGSHIFENTRAIDLDKDEPCRVTTEHGTITADYVIIASHFPFNDKSFYALRMHSHRSYVLAVRVEGPVPQGMFIDIKSTHSIRAYPGPESTLLLIGGEGHKTGQGGDTKARYRRLEEWAREHFNVKAVEYHWSTQDNQTIDRLPYIGKATPNAKHVYVATGYDGWGITNGTVAGMLLRDLILGRDNPWAEVYDPNRLDPGAVSRFAKQTGDVVKHFASDRMTDETPDDIAPGEGKIVNTDNGKVAMYKSKSGVVQSVSPACTHMGCYVVWNSAETSWDCPCHGSRFATDGRVLHGPATKALESKVTA